MRQRNRPETCRSYQQAGNPRSKNQDSWCTCFDTGARAASDMRTWGRADRATGTVVHDRSRHSDLAQDIGQRRLFGASYSRSPEEPSDCTRVPELPRKRARRIPNDAALKPSDIAAGSEDAPREPGAGMTVPTPRACAPMKEPRARTASGYRWGGGNRAQCSIPVGAIRWHQCLFTKAARRLWRVAKIKQFRPRALGWVGDRSLRRDNLDGVQRTRSYVSNRAGFFV
jgi:hypothetical protein